MLHKQKTALLYVINRLLKENHSIVDDGEIQSIYNPDGKPVLALTFEDFQMAVEELQLVSQIKPFGRLYELPPTT
jgi:hypothetical protein